MVLQMKLLLFLLENVTQTSSESKFADFLLSWILTNSRTQDYYVKIVVLSFWHQKSLFLLRSKKLSTHWGSSFLNAFVQTYYVFKQLDWWRTEIATSEEIVDNNVEKTIFQCWFFFSVPTKESLLLKLWFGETKLKNRRKLLRLLTEKAKRYCYRGLYSLTLTLNSGLFENVKRRAYFCHPSFITVVGLSKPLMQKRHIDPVLQQNLWIAEPFKRRTNRGSHGVGRRILWSLCSSGKTWGSSITL